MIKLNRNRAGAAGGLQARIAALMSATLLAGLAIVGTGAAQVAHADEVAPEDQIEIVYEPADPSSQSPAIIPDATRTATLHVVKIIRATGSTRTTPFTGEQLKPDPSYQSLQAEIVSPNCDLESLKIPGTDRPCYPGNVAYELKRIVSGVVNGVNYGPTIDLSTSAGWQAAQKLSALQLADQSVDQCSATVTDNCVVFDSWVYDGTGSNNGTVIVDDYGTATFADIPLGLYYVNQTWADAPAGLMLASPFLVTLPMTNSAQNAWMYDVWVYPKGRVINMAVDKTIENQNKEPGFHVGDIIQYVISAQIPVIWHNTFVQKYKITDQFDPRIVWAHGTGPVVYVDNYSDPKYRMVFDPDESKSDYNYNYCGLDGTLYHNGNEVAPSALAPLTDIYPEDSVPYDAWLQYYAANGHPLVDGKLPQVDAVCGAVCSDVVASADQPALDATCGGPDGKVGYPYDDDDIIDRTIPVFDANGNRVIRKNVMIVELLKGEMPDGWSSTDTILPKGDPFPDWWRGLEKLTELSLPDPDCDEQCWMDQTGHSDADVSVNLFAKAITQGDKIPNGGFGGGTFVELGLDDNTNTDCLATGDCYGVIDVPATCEETDSCDAPSYGGLSLWKYGADKVGNASARRLQQTGLGAYPAAALPDAEFKVFLSEQAATAYGKMSAAEQLAADNLALANYQDYIDKVNSGDIYYYDATDPSCGVDEETGNLWGCWKTVERVIAPDLPLVFFTSVPNKGCRAAYDTYLATMNSANPKYIPVKCKILGFDDEWNPLYNESDPFEATVASINYNNPVVKVTTDSVGHAMVVGLTYGKYWVLETAAPRGLDGMRYDKLTKPVEVIVNGSVDGCYFDAEIGPECDPAVAASDRAYRLDHADEHDDWLIPNVPAEASGPLPSVGGPGVLAFAVLALTILGLTVAALRRQRRALD